MYKYCFLNNKITTLDQAGISLIDLGVLRGYGVFDTLRTYNGKPFLIDEHLERFYTSASELDLKIPLSADKIKEVVLELLKKNEVEDAGIRFVLTGGPADDAFTVAEPTFYILIEHLASYPDAVYIDGVKLITFDHQRHMPHVKTTNYIIPILKQANWKSKDAYDMLYVSDNKVYETTRSNFFVFIGDSLVTANSGVLFGRTRSLVISLASKEFAVEERELTLEELHSAEEAFITGTRKLITPVVKVDDHVIGNGQVGQRTKVLMALFEEYVKNFS